LEVMTHSKKFLIKQRRQKLALLLARHPNLPQDLLAQSLGCHQSTISTDLRALKRESEQFVYDLAKKDLSFHYQQSLRSIEEATSEAWTIFQKHKSDDFQTGSKIKLLALRVVLEASKTKFELLNSGPQVLAVSALQEKVSGLEEIASDIAQ